MRCASWRYRGLLLVVTLFVHCALLVPACSAQGIITTVAGSTWIFRGDGGPAVNAPLGQAWGVAVDSAGNVFVADIDNCLVVKVSPSGILKVVAGNGICGYSGDGGPATAASLYNAQGVAVDAAGNIYVADTFNSRIRKVSPAGIITTVAGGGRGGLGDGGPATAASLDNPNGVAVDAAGNLYVADTHNSRIRKVSPAGTITTVAGNGTYGFSGDGGPATGASLHEPYGVAVDAAGNIYVADTRNSRIRKVSPAGVITTVAGNGTYGFSGDGGPATGASLVYPYGVAVDAAGNIYVADSDNRRIRKVSPTGIITTVAGSGTYGSSGDGGPATGASLNQPCGVAVDAAGNIYVADTYNSRIRKVSPAGIITAVAGNGIDGFSGDGGPATGASLCYPFAVAVDAAGNIYVADTSNDRIREVTYALKISAGGIVNGASFVPAPNNPAAPGALVSIFGQNLSTQVAGASGIPLPTSLAGTEVLINNVRAPLIYVSPGQINAQVPFAPAIAPGNAYDVVVRAQGPGDSSPERLRVETTAPGIFTVPAGGTGQGAILIANTNRLAMPARPDVPSEPAARGGYVSIYCTGLGATEPAVESGRAGPTSEPLARVKTPVSVTIGGQAATVTFAGMAPGFVGLYQVDAQVPAGVTPGDAVPVVMTQGAMPSNTVTMAVK
jgi:uncharacterized protein (TIGR03437 family)